MIKHKSVQKPDKDPLDIDLNLYQTFYGGSFTGI